MASVDTNRTPTKCVDNPDGVPGEIVYDDKTYPMSSPQGPAFAFGGGHGRYRNVPPPNSSTAEEVPMEVD